MGGAGVTGVSRLSKERFHAIYEGVKPYYEYWAGVAVQKTGGTVAHSFTEGALASLLDGIGFIGAIGVTIRLHPSYELIPDVIGFEEPPKGDYPTEPFEVAVEVLMPEDPLSRVMNKCKLYADWGIRQIVVVDPEQRRVWRYQHGSLSQSDVVASRRAAIVPAGALWKALDTKLRGRA